MWYEGRFLIANIPFTTATMICQLWHVHMLPLLPTHVDDSYLLPGVYLGSFFLSLTFSKWITTSTAHLLTITNPSQGVTYGAVAAAGNWWQGMRLEMHMSLSFLFCCISNVYLQIHYGHHLHHNNRGWAWDTKTSWAPSIFFLFF